MLFNLLSSGKVYFSDTLEPISLWLTVGFLCAIFLSLAVCFFIDREHLGKVAKSGIISFILYALVLGIVLLTAEIIKKYDLAYLEDNWVNKDVITHVMLPLLICLVVALIGGIALFVLSKKESKAKKIFSVVFASVLAVSIIASLVLMYLHYSRNISGDGYYTSPESGFNSTLLYVFSAIIIAFTVLLAFVIGRKNKTPFSSKIIAFAGICLSLSFALSFIKFEAAWIQGGSITLFSFLPICLFSYVHGMKKGLLVGVIYGLLQAVQDPFIVHPAQFLLDYPVAFSMITMSGLLTDLGILKNMPRAKFGIGAAITGIFRYVCHVISGVFAFGAYALDAEATNFLTYSAVYNTYVFIDIALVIVVGVILLSSKGFLAELNKMSCLPLSEEK